MTQVVDLSLTRQEFELIVFSVKEYLLDMRAESVKLKHTPNDINWEHMLAGYDTLVALFEAWTKYGRFDVRQVRLSMDQYWFLLYAVADAIDNTRELGSMNPTPSRYRQIALALEVKEAIETNKQFVEVED